MAHNLGSPPGTWLAVLRNLQSALAEVPNFVAIPNKTQFQEELLSVCREYREKRHQLLEGKVYRYNSKIIHFVDDLDDNLKLTGTTTLAAVFWSVTFSVTKQALRRKLQKEVVDVRFERLNQTLPLFGVNLSHFSDDSRVQEPLQRIFKEYIECLRIMLRQFATAPITFKSFDTHLDQSKALFKESKQEWERLVKEAQEAENARMALAASTISNPMDSVGGLHSRALRVHFEDVGSLGIGAFSHVFKVRHISTGNFYARKVLRPVLGWTNERFKKQVENEIRIMERLAHCHITRIVVGDYDESGGFYSIVMLPVADFNLNEYLQKKCINASFPRTELAQMTGWFGCLVSALSFAHANDIKHEDIKPGNILIKDRRPWLADFGSAKDFSESGNSTSDSLIQYGTPVYWPPEEAPGRGRAADVFSLGCVFSEMLTVRQGRTLEEFQAYRRVENRESPYAFRRNVTAVKKWIEDLKPRDDPVGSLLVEQTLRMLEENPLDRPSASDVKKMLLLEHRSVMCGICSS